MNNNQPKVKYQVQRYVQINGIQYGAGLYEVPENIARALDNQGAGARQEDFIQAVAGDAPVIDASANALQTQAQGSAANIPSGIIANTSGEGSPNAPAPKESIQDSTGGAGSVQPAQPLGNMLMNSEGQGGNQNAGGAGDFQNQRNDVENQTVKTETSNLQSLDQNQVQNLQMSQSGAGAGTGAGNTEPNQNQTAPQQSQGATGDLPENFPHKDDLANAEKPIKTYEDLIPMTQDELLKIKGIGKAGVRDIGLAIYEAKQSADNA